jgi:hypothetical protein
MKIVMIFIFTTLTIISINCIADTIPDINEIRNKLIKKGYENISVGLRNDTLFIVYENRVYRLEAIAMVDIIESTMTLLEDKEVLFFICLKRGVPIISVIISKANYLRFIREEICSDEFSESVQMSYNLNHCKNINGDNPSFNKFDLIVHPQIHAQFGNFSDPIESQVNIAPAMNIFFWKGMNLTTQVIFPLQNDLEKKGDYVRPGLLTINQTIRLPYNIFSSLTAGYFTIDRYGIDLETRKFVNSGKISLGVRCGYTGNASVLAGRWIYSEVNLFTCFADASYRYAKYDLTLKAGYGRFIDKDEGWRIDAYRQFGEVSIGFFALHTDGELNGGFNFSIPLPPRKYLTKHLIRIRPASSFAWEYRAKGLPEEGKIYSTGNSPDEYLNNLNPDYIKKLLVNKLTIPP